VPGTPEYRARVLMTLEVWRNGSGGRIILNQIFNKRGVKNWTGLKYMWIRFYGSKFLNTVAYEECSVF
jgi:hypothetical protein